VVDNYPNTEEVKAQDILKDQFLLEKLDFKTTDTKNWRVLYKVAVSEENNKIEKKNSKFMTGATFQDLNYSLDRYSDTESLLIQGINSEAYARNISTILKKIRILK
jgi:hypothetical protein